jgi:hypothetical protein
MFLKQLGLPMDLGILYVGDILFTDNNFRTLDLE